MLEALGVAALGLAALLDDEVSILQVAMDSGFGSLSAFNKCFRKKAGMTPSEFRRERRPIPHPS